jgi:hypothetical protein
VTSIDKEAVRAASRIEEVIPTLTGGALTRRGREVVTPCPFHEDAHPSLRIDIERQRWYCHPCHTGGDVFTFVQRLRRQTFTEALTWLAQRSGLSSGIGLDAPPRRRQSVERTHTYCDEGGQPLFRVVIGGRRPDGTKIVWQEQPDGYGGWERRTRGQRRVVYRLPELHGKPEVVVTEGEQDADRLWAIGIPATCNVGGAGNWTDSDSQQLRNAGVERVRVIGDHDDAGRRHNDVVARSCTARGLEARPVLLPGLPPKGDVSDYLNAGHSRAELIDLIKSAPSYAPRAIEVSAVDPHDDGGGMVDAWPKPVSRVAYVGVVGDIVDALAPHTEADPVAILIQLMAMLGNVIGRTAHFRVEEVTHYLNLFAALVGISSKSRKGVSAPRASQFFRTIDQAWIADRQATGLSTGEGLIYAVRDALEVQRPVKEKGHIIGYEPVIEDHGVMDKRLYVNEPEFANLLKVMMREGNTLSPVVRNAWDGVTLRTLTRNSPLKATGPHISIVGSITQQEVRRYLDVTESANGFGNRFLWFCVRRSQELPDGGGSVDVDPLVERLRTCVKAARNLGELFRDRQASEAWHAEYSRLSAGRPGLLGSITARGEAQTTRLACLYALADGAKVVGLRHLEAAFELWRYCFDSAAYIFGDSLGDTKADAILAALKVAGERGLTRVDMTRDVFKGHLSGAELSQKLAILETAKLAVVHSPEPTEGAGRPPERWFHRVRTCEQSEGITPADHSFASFAPSQPGNASRAVAPSLSVSPSATADVFEVP